jgi:hypothetical protein
VAAEHRIGAADHERGCSQLRRRCEGRFEVGFGARVEYMKPHAECIGYGLQVFRNRRSEWICGVDEQSNGVEPVTLPPGRFKLATRPNLIGSPRS